jgi:integrase
MALTVLKIRAIRPRDKAYKVADEKGLYLLVKPSGAMLWRLKYRFYGVERKLAFGAYPEVSLKEARRRRDDARRQLDSGLDPSAAKRKAALAATLNAAATFRVLAGEFIEKMEREDKAPATIKKARWFMDLLDSDLGHLPVADITPHQLLSALKKVERRGHHETAQRLRAFAGRVFRYAAATVRAERNPADILRGALTAPQVRHHPAIVDPKGVGELMRAIEGYEGRIETKLALRLAPHVFVRPGELRTAEWNEVDFAAAVWRIPAEKMKMRQVHAVPLSRQSLAILKELKALENAGPFIFPALHTSLRCMSENTLNTALRRMGYGQQEMTSHGFRSIASTLLNESGLWHPDAIERALAHGDSNRIRAAYHRGVHWDERVRMAQWWSDYLDQLRAGGKVVEGKFQQFAANG